MTLFHVELSRHLFTIDLSRSTVMSWDLRSTINLKFVHRYRIFFGIHNGMFCIRSIGHSSSHVRGSRRRKKANVPHGRLDLQMSGNQISQSALLKMSPSRLSSL